MNIMTNIIEISLTMARVTVSSTHLEMFLMQYFIKLKNEKKQNSPSIVIAFPFEVKKSHEIIF